MGKQLSGWEREHLAPAEGFSHFRVRPIDLKGSGGSNPWWLVNDEQLLYPCFEGVSISKMHGVRPIGRCGKWTCRNCGELKKRKLAAEIGFCRSVHRGIAVFSVLTFWHKNGVVRNAKTGRVLSDATQMAYIRKWYGAASEVLGTDARCSVPEWHKDGSLHMNVIWFGVRRDFESCDITNKWGHRDMRLQCNRCHACQLRKSWLEISGAERSTHERTVGDTARYVGKYLTKSVTHQTHYTGEGRRKRYSFSHSVKRMPSIVPVYRYIGQTIRDADTWLWGKRTGKSDERWADYITDEGLFLQDESKYSPISDAPVDGMWLERAACSESHHGLCDRVPYWSPTKQRAWDYKHWDWFGRAYGEDTKQYLQDKIMTAWEYIEPQYMKVESYDDTRHDKLAAK